MVVGCSHTGVEKIIEATNTATGKKVDTVAGGFHLFPYDRPYISALVSKVKDELGVRRVSPAHCTGHLAFRAFRDAYRDEYTYGGLGSQITFPA